MNQHIDNLIYLTGFMGSGKSTIGPLVAARLNRPFYDLDQRIEERLQQPIASYFSDYGEDAFRRIERDCLKDTVRWSPAIVALGGGALCNTENLRWTLAHGTVVYLKVSVPTLAARLKNERDTRPMLLDAYGNPMDYEATSARISSLLRHREPYYRQAHSIVEADDRSASAVADRIIEQLSG